MRRQPHSGPRAAAARRRLRARRLARDGRRPRGRRRRPRHRTTRPAGRAGRPLRDAGGSLCRPARAVAARPPARRRTLRGSHRRRHAPRRHQDGLAALSRHARGGRAHRAARRRPGPHLHGGSPGRRQRPARGAPEQVRARRRPGAAVRPDDRPDHVPPGHPRGVERRGADGRTAGRARRLSRAAYGLHAAQRRRRQPRGGRDHHALLRRPPRAGARLCLARLAPLPVAARLGRRLPGQLVERRDRGAVAGHADRRRRRAPERPRTRRLRAALRAASRRHRGCPETGAHPRRSAPGPLLP